MHISLYFGLLSIVCVGSREQLFNIQPVDDPSDCMLTTRGETYSGNRRHVIKNNETYNCYQWSLANWHFMRLVNRNNSVLNQTFDRYETVLKNWIEFEIGRIENQCRNPGGIFNEPHCISNELKEGMLSPCGVPLCNKYANPGDKNQCAINLAGDGYNIKTCPKYKKQFPSIDNACQCSQSKSQQYLGLFYKGQKTVENIPCIFPQCNSDPNSFVVTGGRQVNTWWKLNELADHIQVNVRGFSQSIKASLLLQLRNTPDISDSGINLELSSKHFQNENKATLSVLPIGHIPAITSYLSALDTAKYFNDSILVEKKFWPEVFNSDRWSKLKIHLKYGKVAVSDDTSEDGEPHLMLATNQLTGFPGWVRLQSSDFVEVSLGNSMACPIFLTLPMWETKKSLFYQRLEYGQIYSRELMDKIYQSKLFQSAERISKSNKFQTEGLFFRLTRSYPTIEEDIYVKGAATGNAKIMFTMFPIKKQAFVINLNKKLEICFMYDQKCQNLKEWLNLAQAIQSSLKMFGEQIISEHFWTRFAIRFDGNVLKIFRGIRNQQNKDTDAQKFPGRNIYNNNFVRGVIPSHNFCRNLIRKYTGSAICVGITTGDLVRCQTNCIQARMQRFTLVGKEYRSDLNISRTGRQCTVQGNVLSNVCTVQDDNVQRGISCIVGAHDKSNSQSKNQKQFIYEKCSIPIKNLHSLQLKIFSQFDLVDYSMEYINLLPLRNSLSFGILPASLTNFNGLLMQFYDNEQKLVAQILLGYQNYKVIFRVTSRRDAAHSQVVELGRELLSEEQTHYFQLKFSKQNWIIYDVQHKHSIQTNEILNINKLNIQSLQRVSYMSFGIPGDLSSILQTKVKSVPFNGQESLTLHRISDYYYQTDEFDILFYKQIFSDAKSKKVFKKMSISWYDGSVSITSDAAQHKQQSYSYDKPIEAMSFSLMKMSAVTWLELAKYMCHHKALSIPSHNSKFHQNRSKNQNSQLQKQNKHLQNSQNQEDFLSFGKSLYGKFKEAIKQQQKIDELKTSESNKILFLYENIDGTISTRNQNQDQHDEKTSKEKIGAFQQYEEIKRLLNIHNSSLGTVFPQCKPPLWLNSWIFVVNVQGRNESKMNPFIVMKVHMNSSESIVLANFYNLKPLEQKTELVIESESCTMPSLNKTDQYLQHGQWTDKETWCSQDCGTGFGYHRWKCVNVSINGHLCQINGKYQQKMVVTRQIICNRFPCGTLSREYTADVKNTARMIAQIENNEGSNTSISCITDTLIQIHKDKRFQKKIRLFWYKGDSVYKHGDILTNLGELEFRPSLAIHSGLYQCLLTLEQYPRDHQQNRKTPLTERVVYLAAVRAVIISSSQATNRISLARPFVFYVETSAYCTPQGYQCRTVLLHKIRQIYRIVYDSPIYVESFQLTNVEQPLIGEYKESVWLKYIDKIILYFNAYAANDYMVQHPVLTTLILIATCLVWIMMMVALKIVSELEAEAGDAAAARRARQRILNMGLENHLTPYQEKLLLEQERKEKGTGIMAVFWKFIRIFTRTKEYELTDEFDVAQLGQDLLEQQNLSTSELPDTDEIFTTFSTDDERRENNQQKTSS